MRNSPENTLTPLEPTAPQDWIQVPNPRRQLPSLPLAFLSYSGAQQPWGVKVARETAVADTCWAL